MTLDELIASLMRSGGTAAQALPSMVGVAGRPGMAASAQQQTLGPSNSSIAVEPPPPTVSEASSIAGEISQLTTQSIPEHPQIGTDYAAPQPSPMAPPMAATTPAHPSETSKSRATSMFELPRQVPSIAENIGGFFAGLSGPDALAVYQQRGDKRRAIENSRLASNQTYQALINKGVDASTARAAVMNPDVMRAVLSNVFGGGQTDDWKEYTYAKKEGFEGSFVDFKQQTKRTNQPIKVDAGTSWQLIDPMTREVVSVIPKDISGAAQAKALGTATGDAKVALPTAIQAGEEAVAAIDSLLKNPALGRSVGPQAQHLWSVTPNATAFDAKYDQIKGRAFLQAFQSLRGGGAITEVEGDKATQAIAALSKAQDDADFRSALEDLKDLATRGVANARAKAAGDFSGTAISRGSASTPSGAVRTYNPATGRLE